MLSVLIVQRCLANVGRIQFYTAKHATQSSGKAVTIRDILGLDALALLKDKTSLHSFFICTYLYSTGVLLPECEPVPYK